MYPTITNKTFKSDNKQAILDEMNTHDMIMLSTLAKWLNQRGKAIITDWVLTCTNKPLKDGFQFNFWR